MLKTLKVEQFVIIETLALDFEMGLTIFTGETGAGKSIILGAMSLILGEPATTDSIRQGFEQSVFEALIAPPKGHPVWEFLIGKNILAESDTEFLIHRIMKKSGKDEIQVNGKTIELDLLKEMGTFLVEIHGQFANQSLLGPDNQLHLLDLSGDFPREVFKNVEDALDELRRYEQELEEEKKFLVRHKGLKGKKVKDVCRRFDEIDMYKGFVAIAVEERDTLRTAKETMESFQNILGRFIATNGIIGSLGAANKTLAAQENLDQDKIADLAHYLAEALKYASSSVEEMGRLLPEYEIDVDPLTRYEAILVVMRDIAQDAKIEFDELEDYYDEMSTKLARIKNGRERIAEINNLVIEAKNNYRHHAHILTEKRIEAGKALSKAITAEFIPLMLNKAEFVVVVEEKPDIPWTKLGFNEVTFTARMNPGSPFTPISKTASGGELARMILALKVVLQLVQTTPTLVFDEVDTGIGGAAAAAVGERIAHLAETTQVLVITHSPQVASRGDQHLHITKKTDGVTTTSAVDTLSMDDRIDEISRMLAGDAITDQSQAAAKSLIDEAKTAANLRRKSA